MGKREHMQHGPQRTGPLLRECCEVMAADAVQFVQPCSKDRAQQQMARQQLLITPSPPLHMDRLPCRIDHIMRGLGPSFEVSGASAAVVTEGWLSMAATREGQILAGLQPQVNRKLLRGRSINVQVQGQHSPSHHPQRRMEAVRRREVEQLQ